MKESFIGRAAADRSAAAAAAQSGSDGVSGAESNEVVMAEGAVLPIVPPATLDGGVLDRMVEDLGIETVSVLVDALIEEMLARAQRMAVAAAAGDKQAVQREAHAMKSSTAAYGAATISGTSALIEAGCRDGDVDNALALTRDLPMLAEHAASALAAWKAGRSG